MARYSKETLAKVMLKAKEIEKEYMEKDIRDINLCISTGNRKIGRVMNVSLMPIRTCANCKECKHLCYDIKACLQYKNVIDARIRNTVIMNRNMEEYFARIRAAIARKRTNKYFRWHVAGDMVNGKYFENMVAIAKDFPEWIFWTYTKNYKVVNDYCSEYGRESIPENFHIMFSEWDGMPLINPYNFPIFTCKLKDGNKNHEPEFFNSLFKCPGNCDICKENHTGCIAGMDTYANEH